MDIRYPTTSQTLLEKISKGDEISWNEFYERYKSVVLSVAKFSGICDTDAQDILQEVMSAFFGVSRHFNYRPERAHFRTYFSHVINSRISDYFRRNNGIELVPLNGNGELKNSMGTSITVVDPHAEDFFAEEWRRTMLDDAYAQVRKRVEPDTWQAFELYFLQGRPVRNVARYLECSVNQVYQAKKRCCAMLRDIVLELNRLDSELHLEVKDEDIPKG